MATPSPRSGLPPTDPGELLPDVGADPLLDQAELIRKVHAEATRQGVDPDLVAQVVRRESAWNPKATSRAGARGLMQLMPDTARMMGVDDPDDPDANIRGGVAYLKRLLDQNKEKAPHLQRRLALAAYNAGPAAVARYGGVPPYRETQQYVDALAPLPGGSAGTGDPLLDQAEAIRHQSTAPQPGTPEAEGVAGPPPLGTAPGTPPPAPPDPRLNDPGLLETGATKLALGVHDAFDPMTPSGRRNLASGAGAIAAGVATGGTGLVPALAMAGGAGTLGMVAETGEQIAGTKPYNPDEVLNAGGSQATGELLGHGFAGALQGIGRRAMASGVSRRAFEGLSGAKQKILDTAQAALDTLYKTPVAPPSAAGRTVQRALAGPAQTARDAAGEAVGSAAKSGPPVNISGLKARAQQIVDRELQPAASAFPSTVPEAPPAPAFSVSKALPGESPAAAAIRAQQQALLGEGAEAAVKDKAKSPVMGVLSRILNAEDEVPFEAAHLFKRELNDAVQGTWDRAEKKRLTALTQHLSGGLREALRGANHAPYEAATAAYERIAPLYTKGIAPKLRQQALDNPEEILTLIKPSEPTRVGMLRELLTEQAAEGGGARQGRQAWDTVRATWTHEKVIRGPVESLGKRLDKLSPEFAEVFYDDVPSQQVLTNLHSIADGFTAATKQLAADKEAFAASSLAPSKTRSPEEFGADVLRAGALGLNSIWGGLSVMRLLRGPRSQDLVTWAAYSPAHTKLLVHAMTSPIPGEALAQILRGAGLTDLVPSRSASGPPGRPQGGIEALGPPGPPEAAGGPPARP